MVSALRASTTMLMKEAQCNVASAQMRSRLSSTSDCNPLSASIYCAENVWHERIVLRVGPRAESCRGSALHETYFPCAAALM